MLSRRGVIVGIFLCVFIIFVLGVDYFELYPILGYDTSPSPIPATMPETREEVGSSPIPGTVSRSELSSYLILILGFTVGCLTLYYLGINVSDFGIEIDRKNR